MNDMTKRCYKSTVDRKFAGVCGGIAEYFGVDSTLIRLIWIALSMCLGSGLLFYILAAIVMPDRSAAGYDHYQGYGNYDRNYQNYNRNYNQYRNQNYSQNYCNNNNGDCSRANSEYTSNGR